MNVESEPGRLVRMMSALIGLVAVIYLMQIATPLRLDNDVVWYLRMTMAFADGLPIPHMGVPVGYSILLGLLDRVGALSSHSIVALNCLAIGAGLWSVSMIQREESQSTRVLTVLLSLCAFSLVRTVAMPLPEAVFFGVSLCTLAVMSRAYDSERVEPGLLLLAVVLTAVSLIIRTAAVALIPALLLCVAKPVMRIAPAKRKIIAPVVIGAVLVLVIAAFFVTIRDGTIARYIAAAKQTFGPGPIYSIIGERIRQTFTRVGELSLNLPVLKLAFLGPVLPWIGAVFAALLLLGLKSRRRVDPVTVYVAFYLVMIVIWPFDATRYWVPILPFLIWYAIDVAVGYMRTRVTSTLLRAYAAVFIVIGFGALAYTTRISYAGDRFRYVYGDNGGMTTPGWELKNREHNYYAAIILKRYDPHQAALQVKR